MVVCCAAQEASVPHPWVINRNDFHVYVAPWHFNKTKDFCGGNASQCHSKFQVNHAKHLFLFSSFRQGVKVVIKHKSIIRLPWNLVTLKGGIRAHPDTKFDCISINGHKVINNYLWKITPICDRISENHPYGCKWHSKYLALRNSIQHWISTYLWLQ